jgi:hypothetical protein
MAILKGLVIASVGDINDSSGKSISNEQLKKWVVNNKGRWTPEVGKGTTHLISSANAYKRDAKAGMPNSWRQKAREDCAHGSLSEKDSRLG